MTPDHCAMHCDRGHFCSILVSNIFCDPLFLLNGLIGLLSSRQFSEPEAFSTHPNLYSRVIRRFFTATDLFGSATLPCEKSQAYFFIGPYHLYGFIIAQHSALDN